MDKATLEKTNSPSQAAKPAQQKFGILSIPKKLVGTALSWFGNFTSGAGEALNLVGRFPLLNNPVVKRLVSVLRLDWLTGMASQVDTAKAEAEVRELQQKYPNESPSQIAHRLMIRKAKTAGRNGFVTSMLPGFATALLAIDIAATTALQTELVYEIAAAYGLDLRDPARKGEALSIFGLALGGGTALKAGLGFMRNIPFAGAFIGASTNATLLYSLGYAASRFYEAKLESETDEPSTEALQEIQQQGERYLDVAIAQQTVMDQIVAHMILASHPEKSWEDILPALKTLRIEPNSMRTIEENLRSPQPLGALLDQLNCDFAVPLLGQCRAIAESKDGVSEKESEILEAIRGKCSDRFSD